MRAKFLILLTSQIDPKEFLEGSRRTVLAHRVRSYLDFAAQHRLIVVLVLGPAGDDVLQLDPDLEKCELAFDPNYQGEVFSSLQAGLHATSTAAMVVSLSEPLPLDELWRQIQEASDDLILNTDSIDAVVLVTQLDGHLEMNWPQFITHQGTRRLRGLPAQTPWGPPKNQTPDSQARNQTSAHLPSKKQAQKIQQDAQIQFYFVPTTGSAEQREFASEA